VSVTVGRRGSVRHRRRLHTRRLNRQRDSYRFSPGRAGR
jgi:hypothetical protein